MSLPAGTRLGPYEILAPALVLHYWMTVGRTQESLVESQQALEAEPLDPTLSAHLGWHYLFARQYDQALVQLRHAAEMNPNHYLTRIYLGWAYEQNRKYPEAIGEFQRAAKLLDLPEPISCLGHAYAASGNRTEALKMLARLQELSGGRYVSPFYFAVVYVALGEKDRAMEWLEKGFAERAAFLHELNRDPRFDPLRSDVRFQQLVRRMGLPP